MRRALLILLAATAAPSPAAATELDASAHLTITNLPLGSRSETRTLAPAGDFNGDGIGDVAIGSSRGAHGENDSLARGEVHIVFGRRERSTINASNLGAAGLRVVGPRARRLRLVGENGSFMTRAGELLGTAVAPAGDVNGDGLADVLAGAPYGGRTRPGGGFPTGRAYVILGRAAPGTMDLGREPAAAIRLDAPASTHAAGVKVAAAGDVNGDGRPDLAIGASPDRRTAPTGWIVYGGALPPAVDLGRLGEGGVTLIGTGGGIELSTAGDQDGDGMADVVVGAPNDEGATNRPERAGRAFLAARLAGGGVRDLRLAPSLRGAPREALGDSVAGGLDTTGDGVPDIVLGAPGDEHERGAVGRIRVVPGPWPVQARDVRRAGGLVLRERAESSGFGARLDLLPDSTGDGAAEILTGAPRTSPGCRRDAGSAWVIDGGPGHGAAIAGATRPATRLTGRVFGGGAGAVVAAAGDVTGDGRPDVLVGDEPEDDVGLEVPEFRTVHVVPAPGPAPAPAVAPEPEGDACFTASVVRRSARRLLRTGRLRVRLESRVPLGRRAFIHFELTPVSRAARRRFIGASYRADPIRLRSPGSTIATIRLNRRTLRRLRPGDVLELVFFGDPGTTGARTRIG